MTSQADECATQVAGRGRGYVPTRLMPSGGEGHIPGAARWQFMRQRKNRGKPYHPYGHVYQKTIDGKQILEEP